MSKDQTRRVAAALGAGAIAFGVVPVLSPGLFARLFGLHPPSDPTLAAAFRSVGARDIAVGMGLWSAAAYGGNYAPWLLARAICDGGDTLAALLAIRAGARDPRFLGLTALAFGATAASVLLHRQAR
jgi:hypothetical protein